MKRRTKLLLVIVAGLLIIGGVFGATAAFADNPSDGAPAADLMQKIARNYQTITGQDLDTAALRQAFEQAREQVRSEQQQAFLDRLVEDGVITREQADRYRSWLDSRPDIPQLNGEGHGRLFGPRGLGHFFGGNGHWDQDQAPDAQASF
jgi:hypothetical protein